MRRRSTVPCAMGLRFARPIFPGTLAVIGEVRAGTLFGGSVGAGQAVEIMTGAPVPAGADTVVMVEHCQRRDGSVEIGRGAEAGQNICARGAEARGDDVVLRAGVRIDYSHIALAASVGRMRLKVFHRPEVAIVSTGDEVVATIESTPEPFQIRNSNAASLAAQIARAGGLPRPCRLCATPWTALARRWNGHSNPTWCCCPAAFRRANMIWWNRRWPSLEQNSFSTAWHSTRPAAGVRARPGKFFFGFPGNPASSMVTFEVFARAALELIAGQTAPSFPSPSPAGARFQPKPGLTRFLPATLAEGEVTPIGWRGSGDINALARANVFMVTDPDRTDLRCRRPDPDSTNEETLALRFRRRSAHGGCFAEGPDRAHRAAQAFVRIAPQVLRNYLRIPKVTHSK